MKKQIAKIILLVIFSLIALFYLIKFPLKQSVSVLHYDAKNEIKIYDFGSKVVQNLKIENDSTNRIIIFIDENIEYDNLKICIFDSKGKTIFKVDVPNYNSFAMIYDFMPISKGDYKLVIEDLDGDSIRLATLDSYKNNYILENKDKTLRLASYFVKDNNFYLWYPLFLIVFLFTIFPFVWVGDKSEK